MRNLVKKAKPTILREHEDEWTLAYVTAGSAEERKRNERWRHQSIQETLADETNRKCAYCEARVSDVSYPHVEHIVPKVSHPNLAHKWENLTYVCQRCNTLKGDRYDEDCAVVNPYEDDVDEFIEFIGTFARGRLGQPRGEITISTLDLNRIDLWDSRVSRLNSINQMLERWHGAEGTLKHHWLPQSSKTLTKANSPLQSENWSREATLSMSDIPTKLAIASIIPVG